MASILSVGLLYYFENTSQNADSNFSCMSITERSWVKVFSFFVFFLSVLSFFISFFLSFLLK